MGGRGRRRKRDCLGDCDYPSECGDIYLTRSRGREAMRERALGRVLSKEMLAMDYTAVNRDELD